MSDTPHTPDRALAQLSTARLALAECKTAMEAKQIADAAEAARVYLERTNASVETVNQATEVRLMAERQMGEFLATMPKATGARMAGGTEGGAPVVTDGNHRDTPTLSDMGISKKQSAQAQRLAKLPKDEFEERLAVAKADGGKLTVAKVLPPPRSAPPPRSGGTPPPAAGEVINPKTFGEVCADAIFAVRVDKSARGEVMTKADVARVIDEQDAKRTDRAPAVTSAPPTPPPAAPETGNPASAELGIPSTPAKAASKPGKNIPPSPEEVTRYSAEIGYPMNGQAWCDEYAKKGWKVGKNPMKDWQAAVRSWKTNRWGLGTITVNAKGDDKPRDYSRI